MTVRSMKRACWIAVMVACGFGCPEDALLEVHPGDASDAAPEAAPDAEAADDAEIADSGGRDDAELDASAPIDSGVETSSCAMDLSVMTFNLLHGFPRFENLDARTQMVIDTINLLQPDFVALQEIAQSFSTDNRGEVIALATGYSWTWAKAAGTSGVFEAGPGILSKQPFLSTADFDLPRPIIDNLVERKLIETKVMMPCGEVGFFSTHIGELDDLDPTFAIELAVGAYQLMIGEISPGPNFLGATINEEPDTDAIRVLRGEIAYEGVTGTLRDSWIETSTTEGPTYPSDNPRHRLDYIFMRDGELSTTTATACMNVLDQPIGGVYPSDHIGVFCRYRITVRD